MGVKSEKGVKSGSLTAFPKELALLYYAKLAAPGDLRLAAEGKNLESHSNNWK
jgi:hypothetical protein